MRHIAFLIIMSIPFYFARAQQNLFNVPSSDITLKSRIFFQQQFNINSNVIQLNSTFCYGLGRDAELGVNIVGLNLNPDFKKPIILSNDDESNPPNYPYFTLNFQKSLTLNKIFKLAAGTQTGLSKGLHWGNYTYLNLISIITRSHSKIITGAYYATENYFGPGDRNPFANELPIGWQIGLEQSVIKDKLLLIAENISGKHYIGETTLGMAYYINYHWVISTGFQFPNPNSQTSRTIVLELTYVPSAAAHKKIYHHGHHVTT